MCLITYSLYGQLSYIIGATVNDVKVRRRNQFNCQGEMYAPMGHFYVPIFHLAASAPVNGSPSAHRSINNVYILTSCAVMYIPAIIGGPPLMLMHPLTYDLYTAAGI